MCESGEHLYGMDNSGLLYIHKFSAAMQPEDVSLLRERVCMMTATEALPTSSHTAVEFGLPVLTTTYFTKRLSLRLSQSLLHPCLCSHVNKMHKIHLKLVAINDST